MTAALEERIEELEIGLMVISSCINNGYIKTARNEIDRLLNTRKAASAGTDTAVKHPLGTKGRR